MDNMNLPDAEDFGVHLDENTQDRTFSADPPFIPAGEEQTEESAYQYRARKELLNEREEGIVSENELLEQSVITDNDLAVENLENDMP